MLGSRYQQEGNHTEANACYEKGLARNPNKGLIWVNKGAALMALNREKDAVVCFDRAIALDPNDSGATRRLKNCFAPKLAEIGWRIDAGKLVPGSSPIRELLLTQGTEYDSSRADRKGRA